MADLVLDSGGVIAYERDERKFWTALKLVGVHDSSLIIPAPVLAQCWRGPQQVRIARLVKASEIVPMEYGLARAVGELCGDTGTADIVDATVAVIAARFSADVATSDHDDLLGLLRAAGGRGRVLPL